MQRKKTMSEIIKDRSSIENEYKWDLTPLYASDSAWEEDILTLDKLISDAASFKGSLDSTGNIKKFFDASTALERKLSNLFTYASLRKSEDTRENDPQSMFSRIYAKYVQAQTELAFSDPEILALPEDVLKAIAADPLLDEYGMTMTRLLRRKPHTLSEKEERLIASFGEVLGAPGQIASALQDADLVYDSVKDKDGNTHELSQSNYILMQSDSDRALRENSFKSFYKTYRQHINTFAQTYAACVKASVAEGYAKNYASSLESHMAYENVPRSVYESLIKAVREKMGEMYKYVSLRKKILGVDELHYYDLYAPLAKGDKKSYSFDEAKKMLFEAVKPLGGRYRKVVEEAFANRWIDVYPNTGKQGGAYSSGSYDSYPYLMLNFVGTLDRVSTLAHEMGHSVHSYFSKQNQPPQDADYTIFVAEVASTVNENLLIEMLLEENKKKRKADPGNAALKEERMALLNQYLEGFKGTVYRQTMFAEFELKAHEAEERGEALTAECLSSIYLELIKDYFGPELVIDEEVKYEWARIPHFYTPFYVYKYATSYSAAVAVSESILNDAKAAGTGDECSYSNPSVKRFLEFLSMGGSMDPLDELRHAGVDLSVPGPIVYALEKFGKVLKEAEELLG
jgi:oligoendopeptidase F